MLRHGQLAPGFDGVDDATGARLFPSASAFVGIPEPGTAALSSLELIGLGGRGRWRRQPRTSAA
jgi:hypothetical protein